MTPLAALLLGLIQGITEFLPVSSDGHLALGQLILGDALTGGGSQMFFDVLVHVATMLAVIVHFRRELIGLLVAFKPGVHGAMARRVIGLIVTTSIPTAIIGFAIKDACERAFQDPLMVALGFLGTSAFLASTIIALRRRTAQVASDTPSNVGSSGTWFEDLAAVRWRDALAIGAAQGLAPWPGLSRSGTTISTALWMGVPPVTAARYSLIASLPAIGGAFLLSLHDLEGEVPSGLGAMLLGFVVAGVVGYLAIGWLLTTVRKARLGWFALYTLLLGLVVGGLALAGA